MAAKMIHTGERPANQIKRAAPIGIISCLWDSLIDLAVVRQGTAMSATTAGRNPLNIFAVVPQERKREESRSTIWQILRRTFPERH